MQSIYILSDPRTKRVRYVGKSVNPHNRLEQHIDEISNSAKGQWIQELRAHGLEPQMTIVDDCPDKIVYALEYEWMTFGKKKKWQLTNSVAPPKQWRARAKRMSMRWAWGLAGVAMAILYILMNP